MQLFFGRLRTLDSAHPRAEALAVSDEKIRFVGRRDEALAFAGPGAAVHDFGDRTIVPGFCDAHLHLASYGMSLLRHADLVGADRIEALLERMAQHAARYEGPWVQGRGFDQDKLKERAFPTRADLDRVSARRPLLITRICGHAVVANSAALASLTPEERAAGDPETGLYTETAIEAFYRRIPPLSETEQEEAVLRAASVALASGITSVGTLLDVPEQMGAFSRLRRKGRLPLRVTGMPPYASIAGLHARGVDTTFGDDWLRFGGAKLFSDGSLGARTALLSAPYADEDRPQNLGVRIYPADDLKAMAADAQAKGFQVVLHAIGDQAVRESIDALEAAREGQNSGFSRHRIEHASLLPPAERRRMAAAGIVAVVQPQFVTSDTWTGARVGPERAAWAYPFRQMLDEGIPLALSSDCPVERLDAFACLAAAVFRAPWSPDNRLTVEEALRCYCLGGAYALHQEERLGSLTPGKWADFAVLSGDPEACSDADALRGLRADAVFVAGRPAA